MPKHAEVGPTETTINHPSENDLRSMHQKSNAEGIFAGKAALADDDDAEDIYDWSTDEDLDEEVKLEFEIGGESSQKRWGCKRIATFLLSTLIGSTLFAGAIVAVALVFHFFYFIPHPTDDRRYITDNVSAWLYWAAANLLLSLYLAMIVDMIPILCKFMIGLAWGEVNELVQSRLELYNAAKNKIKPVLYAASGWVSWIIIFGDIYNLYDRHHESNSRAYYTPRTYQAVRFLFFFTLVLSAEQLLSNLIAFAFHRKAYNDRLKILKHDLKLIVQYFHWSDFLRQKNPTLAVTVSNQFTITTHQENHTLPNIFFIDAEHDRGIEDQEHGGPRSRKGKARMDRIFPSVWSPRQSTDSVMAPSAPTDQPYDDVHGQSKYPPMPPYTPDQGNSAHSERVASQLQPADDADDAVVIQAAKVLKSAALHDARNINGKEDISPVPGLNINSAREAKNLARSIYVSFKGDHHRRYLIPSDLYPAYAKREDAEDAFKVFDKDDHGDISREEIKTKILKIYQERRALSKSLRDVRQAIRTLDRIMTFIAMIVLFFISLSVFDIGIGSSLTSFYTIGIAASFIFKNAASSAFDAVIFLFVTHPFDTGDRVFVDAENLVVKKMGLFATTFSRADGTETYYFNSQLFTKFITNVRRSGTMFENLTIQVAWRTPLEKLDQLEKYMNNWLATEENRWFEPHTAVTLQKIEYQRALELTLGIGHNGTWQDWGLRNARKTAFLSAAHFYCRQLGITFYHAPQPILITKNDGPLFGVGSLTQGSQTSLQGTGTRSTSNVVFRDETKGAAKPVLGFLPPTDKKASLTRARKSRLRKGSIRGTADVGGDG